MKAIPFVLSCVVGAVVGIVAYEHSAHAQQIAGLATIGFVDSDAACSTWPTANGVYTLTHTPSPAASFQMFVNGIRWTPGNDFTVKSTSVTLMNGQALSASDEVSCSYRTFNVTY